MVGNISDLPVILAIDGGGSKTEAAVVDVSGHILAYHRTGPTNPNDLGEPEAVRRLTELLTAFDCPLRPAAVFAGISGAVGHEEPLSAALTAVFPGVPAGVRTDIYNLFGLLPDADADCAALICGTGAVCFVRKRGILHRIGGWGWLLDSHTGGYAIGRDGMEAALRAADGRGEPTALYDAAVEYLGEKPEAAVGRIYDGGKTRIAGFAPRVFDMAEAGDPAASQILDASARELTLMLRTAAHLLEKKEWDCVMSGSVISDPRMSRRLSALLGSDPENAGFRVHPVLPSLPQLAGAAHTAFRSAGIRIPDSFDPVFREDYARIR